MTIITEAMRPAANTSAAIEAALAATAQPLAAAHGDLVACAAARAEALLDPDASKAKLAQARLDDATLAVEQLDAVRAHLQQRLEAAQVREADEARLVRLRQEAGKVEESVAAARLFLREQYPQIAALLAIGLKRVKEACDDRRSYHVIMQAEGGYALPGLPQMADLAFEAGTPMHGIKDGLFHNAVRLPGVGAAPGYWVPNAYGACYCPADMVEPLPAVRALRPALPAGARVFKVGGESGQQLDMHHPGAGRPAVEIGLGADEADNPHFPGEPARGQQGAAAASAPEAASPRDDASWGPAFNRDKGGNGGASVDELRRLTTGNGLRLAGDGGPEVAA